MKKAEINLKNHYVESFGKNEKQIIDAKNNSLNLNETLVNNIKEIKKELISRLDKNETNNFLNRNDNPFN